MAEASMLPSSARHTVSSGMCGENVPDTLPGTADLIATGVQVVLGAVPPWPREDLSGAPLQGRILLESRLLARQLQVHDAAQDYLAECNRRQRRSRRNRSRVAPPHRVRPQPV
ncbi:hypothetical protein GCM10010178_79820 [Lentzea flava]|uniref:Uncharacterized protein n=1 Tax=Lentzea flava TaxID=103732 RepID=A0ABQ2VCY1_9PSEU|nr:hypothetical protein GCM10010178_79820 [Lentzea flava]